MNKNRIYYIKKYYLIVVLLVLPFYIFSQTKYEKEIRLKNQEMPIVAKEMIESINFSKKIKWYKEIGINRTSFEAKTKHFKKKYSIEFSQEGIFEDVEIEIKTKNIPNDLLEKFTTYFKDKYKKHKINKVQIQYTASPSTIIAFIKDKTMSDEIQTNYELVVSAKVDQIFKKYEYLFSEDGVFLKVAEIIDSNTDYIDY